MSTIPQRRSRTQQYDLEEDDAYYITRQPTSAVRYTPPGNRLSSGATNALSFITNRHRDEISIGR
jgi:hypothetical protein